MLHKKKVPLGNIHSQLQSAHTKAKKRLGQNFLIDENIRNIILEAAELSATDTVLEVGPGTGILTEKLAQRAARVAAVELDETLAKRLKQKLAGHSNLEVVHADILHVNLNDILGSSRPYKVVANIPYYITSPILHMFMHGELKPALMVIMMQKEVAQDVTARPGKMTFLSVSMQIFSRPAIVCRVPAASFYPLPRVDSAVVKFNMLPVPAITVENMDDFLQFVHSGFAAPRKQLRNSLAIGLKKGPAEAEELLKLAKIDSQRRPGTLELAEWWDLYCIVGGVSC
ncbi:MAG: 16S rRNA (adenine(1518)-N(6)/adenine(1519)-N(6))-dimethyltransferase RsmA [Dehalococcoidia bacterium]